MTLTNQRRRDYGKRITANIDVKFGIKIRRIEKKEDLEAKNIVATFKPQKNKIDIKLKEY